MARPKKTNNFNWQKFLARRRSALGSGIVALIVIVAGFLAFSNLSTTTTTKSPTPTNQTQTNKNQTSSTTTNKTSQPSTPQAKASPIFPTQHTVTAGESLWKIAQNYYADGYKWVQISQANNLTNPDKLRIGMVLTIPALSNQTPSPQTVQTQPNINQKPSVSQQYTVVKGDSLWKISISFYGTGYNWYKIRDANAEKVGLLPNGRPLITPGTVLTIPTG